MKVKFRSENLLEDGEECQFIGTVTVEVPPHHERSRFILDSGVGDLATMGPMDRNNMDDMIKRANKAAEIAERSSKMVLSKVVECDLAHSDGETVLKTAEELWSHPDASPIVEGLIQKFTTNFASGKTKPS